MVAKRRAPAKKSPAKKSPAKKSSTTSRKKSAKRAPTKKAAPKKATKQSKIAASRRRPARRELTPYERRNANAKSLGYDSYWDERQSRVRSRKALNELGASAPSVADVDELGTLGRGESARELYYKTKRILERYEPAPSDRQIWALIRIFYKPRRRR